MYEENTSFSSIRSMVSPRSLSRSFATGPIVRIGPQQLSVQGTEAVEAIYGPSSKWTKPQKRVPLSIHSHGVKGDAMDLREMLVPCFSAEAIEAQQHVILNCADTALTVMEIACENEDGKVDILQITRTFAFDVISIITSTLQLTRSGDFVWRILAREGYSFREENAFVFT